MRGPRCPDHGDEVLRLALGRLQGDPASEAERLARECPVCREWWQERFAGEARAVVEDAVGDAWAAFEPPRRSRRRWLAVAAAVVAAAGLAATLSVLPQTETTKTHMVSRVFAGSTDEGSDLNRDGRTDASDLALALQRN